ncbi:hypothetical protein AYO21_06718 [Fonsecaea monophora]|uniref:Uncharacterized protein n=1 Tax=Fonsecaea monophora TaxID=254056 RepID=A0A177F434_9EURO|nr:hypothetical protein AYO21_06718 [Fonsecaea monophora]KAH0829800.1 hypothetical protein FOPE_10862 [Fonsecaea pedrosoi]OAG38998.1 hypothetical protein AYO21_06718 [Fonsecaea monophora]
MASYKVYIARFKSMPVFHDAVYIEAEQGKGWIYQVMGGHGPGWQYDAGQRDDIEGSGQFYMKYEKGTVAQADLSKVDGVCRSIPVPRNQEIEGVVVRRDCRHWVLDALEQLKEHGIYQEMNGSRR